MKTNKLSGAALDWAVAWAENITIKHFSGVFYLLDGDEWNPTRNWARGGPIIERECIDLQYQGGDVDVWAADIFGADCSVYGDTLLIAAMRCYVTSKLGDEIDLPEDLNKEQT
jgi:hypothetical protein